MRRRPGIGGLQTAAAARVLKDQYRILGENVARLKTDLMKEQLATFRSQLEEFARKHKTAIRKNPNSTRCVLKLELASNTGFWAELFQIGDW
ncbi:vacuolar protein sorting-associated protein 22 homolog 1-like [Populus nigra]|uniref:vacuolar protein sorting-associated protein 22 homolog 1-like n=1 Tax=Populus nigra TaxID=3691 RepID=UPI002B279423|nr:vacuolar protein sorting-associated protein 22 homolog 1-like [Populus nigra]XP_061982854.1 vacuolar protein sorting-associated protein 22 homolog 1-like [Populus nigra]